MNINPVKTWKLQILKVQSNSNSDQVLRIVFASVYGVLVRFMREVSVSRVMPIWISILHEVADSEDKNILSVEVVNLGDLLNFSHLKVLLEMRSSLFSFVCKYNLDPVSGLHTCTFLTIFLKVSIVRVDPAHLKIIDDLLEMYLKVELRTF